MIELGQVKSNDTLRFSDWVKSKDFKAGMYPIQLIFTPAKYPSGGLIFEAGDVRVKISIKADKFKVLMKAIKNVLKGNEEILFVVDEFGNYGVDIGESNSMRYWQRTDYGYKYAWAEESEDVPF